MSIGMMKERSMDMVMGTIISWRRRNRRVKGMKTMFQWVKNNKGIRKIIINMIWDSNIHLPVKQFNQI